MNFEQLVSEMHWCQSAEVRWRGRTSIAQLVNGIDIELAPSGWQESKLVNNRFRKCPKAHEVRFMLQEDDSRGKYDK